MSSGTPLFQWTGVEGTSEYRIQIATDPDFTNIVIDQELSSSLTRGSATHAADAVASDPVQSGSLSCIALAELTSGIAKVGAWFDNGDSSTAQAIAVSEGDVPHFEPAANLSDGDYYWHVKAYHLDASQQAAETGWSRMGHFTISTQYPSDFANTVPLAGELSSNPKVIGTNLLFALILVLMFYIAATLFNSALRENYETIHGWLVRPLKRFAKPNVDSEHHVQKSMGRFLLEGFGAVAVTALLYCFLDPYFTQGLSGVALFIALAIALAVVTFFYEGVQILFSKYRFGVPAAFKIHPIALVLAVVFVLISRAVHFHPGLILGFVGACVPLLASRHLNKRQHGVSILCSAVLLAVVCILAFFLRTPVSEAMAGHESFGWALLDMILAAVFIIGLEGLLFALIPLMFVDGERLAKWNKWVWLTVFTVVVFLFYYIIINKDGEIVDAMGDIKVQMMFVITGVFFVLSVAVWLFFRLRHKRSAVKEHEAEHE